MAVSYICDWCGEDIAVAGPADRGCASIDARGLHADFGLVTGSAGHFHAGNYRDADSCLQQVMRLLAQHCQGNAERPPVSREQREHDEWREWCETRDAGRAAWRSLDRNVKAGRVLTALGDDALICSEIAERIVETHPDVFVDGGNLKPILSELLATGDVDKVKEARSPNHQISAKGGWHWRWSRNVRAMTPELQDLERRLKEA